MSNIKKRYWSTTDIAEELNVYPSLICHYVKKIPYLEPKKRLNGTLRNGQRRYTEKERNKVVEAYRLVNEEGYQFWGVEKQLKK